MRSDSVLLAHNDVVNIRDRPKCEAKRKTRGSALQVNSMFGQIKQKLPKKPYYSTNVFSLLLDIDLAAV